MSHFSEDNSADTEVAHVALGAAADCTAIVFPHLKLLLLFLLDFKTSFGHIFTRRFRVGSIWGRWSSNPFSGICRLWNESQIHLA